MPTYAVASAWPPRSVEPASTSGSRKYGLGELEPHGVGVDLLDLALLAVDRHRRRRRGDQVLVPVDVLEPEHEVVGGERLAVAPLHARGAGAGRASGRRPASRSPWRCSGRPCRRCSPRTAGGRGRRAAAIAVPEVGRTGEAAAPGAAVLADLVERLDDQRVLPDALGDRRQLAGLDQLGQLRGLLERLGELGGVGDDLRPLELADQGALGGDLSERPHGDEAAECPHHEGDRESGPEPLCPRHAPKLAHDVVPFRAYAGRWARAGPDYGDNLAASRYLFSRRTRVASLLRPAARRRKPARARRRVQLRGGARRQPARRTFCTLSRLPRAPTKQMGPYPRSRRGAARRRRSRCEAAPKAAREA